MSEHSVLIRTYNHAPFITDCVESLLGQTKTPDEIVVYDEGSTDETVTLVRRFGKCVRLIEVPPGDTASPAKEAHAIHSAFRESHGRIVFLLDGDDRFKPEKIARYTEAFENHPDASVVQAPLERVDARGVSLGVNLEPRFHVTQHLREIYRHHDVNFFYPPSALAFSRYYLERVLPLDLSDALSLSTNARLCVLAPFYGRVVTLLDPLTDWRCHRATDDDRARAALLQIQQVFMRAEIFNRFCRRHHLRTISPWRCRRLYLHFARYAVPPRFFNYCAERLRPLCDSLSWVV